MRPVLVIAHRWAGLTIAAFLLVAAVTGAALPFYQELTWACAPRLWAAAPPRAGARPLGGPELAARLAAEGLATPAVPLDIDGRHAVQMFVTAAPGRPALGYDQVALDPYTGAVRARTKFGALRVFPRDLPGFLYGLHYGYVAGTAGEVVFGVAALLWTLDCFVGFALTLPLPRRRPARAGAPAPRTPAWLTRWAPAWTVRRHARGHRLTFDLHRAGGLWLWPLLLVFAWSAVAMSLPQAHDPVMRMFGEEGAYRPPALPHPQDRPRLSLDAAARRGRELLAQEAARRGFRAGRGVRLDYRPAEGVYRYMARSTLDVASEGGDTEVWFFGDTGRLLRFQPPLGRTGADAFDAWLVDLHEAQVFGLPYRLFVCLFGLLVSGLTITGVLVWTKKRSARLLGAAKRRGALPLAKGQLSPG